MNYVITVAQSLEPNTLEISASTYSEAIGLFHHYMETLSPPTIYVSYTSEDLTVSYTICYALNGAITYNKLEPWFLNIIFEESLEEL